MKRLFLPALLFLAIFSMPARAAVIGFEDFEGNAPIGWDADLRNFNLPLHTLNPSYWRVGPGDATTATLDLRVVDGNTKCVTNGTLAFRTYNGVTLGPTDDGNSSDERIGAMRAGGTRGIVSFEFTVTGDYTAAGAWAGLSFYDFGAEKFFFGYHERNNPEHCLGIDYEGNPNVRSDIVFEPGKTYQIVSAWDYSRGGYADMWIFDAGHTISFSDLYAPHLTSTQASTNWNSGIRIASGGGMEVLWDNIKVATSYTDIFGVSEDRTRIRESFSGYNTGDIVGQGYRNYGQQLFGKWSGGVSAQINSGNLEYTKSAGWSSEDGLLAVGQGQGATMTPDFAAFGEWGLLGTDGKIGGAGVDGALYYGFLVQYIGTGDGDWSGGAQLFRNGGEVLGLVKAGRPANDFGGFYYDPGQHVISYDNHLPIDNDVHLILARIGYNAGGLDDLTVWFDPDLSLAESENVPVLAAALLADLSFDTIIFRNGDSWNYDELRMAATWNALLDDIPGGNGAVPEPAAWIMLLAGIGGLGVMARRR